MTHGQRARAEQIARRASGLSARHPRLAECLARLRLAQGRPETALRIIEGCREVRASLRLLRATCLITVGRRAEAQADLLRWSEQASAPLDARLLLGLMERQAGDQAEAQRTLRRNLRHLEDPRTITALLLQGVLRERPRLVAMWADRLRACREASCAGGPDPDLVLASLGMPGRTSEVEPTPEQANALAVELIMNERAIGPLVEAQRLSPHAPTARLLRDAIVEALDDLDDTADACEALARLSIVLGERDDAVRWARRGLEANPMSASLALLVADLMAEMQPAATGSDERGQAA
jgi:tetratricopeptide (TPR) repeat protein